MVAKYFLVKLLKQVSHMMRRLRLNMYRAEDEMYIIRWHPQYDFLRGVRKIKSKAMTIVLDVQEAA